MIDEIKNPEHEMNKVPRKFKPKKIDWPAVIDDLIAYGLTRNDIADHTDVSRSHVTRMINAQTDGGYHFDKCINMMELHKTVTGKELPSI